MSLKEIICRILSYVNRVLPKFDQVIVEGYPNTESSAISVANYICEHYDIPVYYVVFNNLEDDPGSLLSSNIIILDYYGNIWQRLYYLKKYLTSKFIFFTHGSILHFFSSNQIVTNIWHGVLYKRVRVLNGNSPIPATITVATSQSTKEMFASAFGVRVSNTFVSGYPRNDMLLNAKKNKKKFKENINQFNAFEKIAIWMPTYRKNAKGGGDDDGKEVGNPFYIKGFDISHFNQILKENNTLCLVKPHPYAPVYRYPERLNNVRFVDNKWISEQGLTLYQLLGCTDLLISDVSSVIIDYMLMNSPIICMSADFEEYRETRGFYFDEIENWIPSRINKDQESFFNHLKEVLKNKADPSREKREKLKTYFFDYHDAYSTERLVKYVLNNEN